MVLPFLNAHARYPVVQTTQDMLVRGIPLHGLVMLRPHANALRWLVCSGIKKGGPLVVDTCRPPPREVGVGDFTEFPAALFWVGQPDPLVVPFLHVSYV